MAFCKILLTILMILGGLDSVIAQIWTPATNAPSENWSSIASSADGSKLVVVNDNMYFNGDNYVFDGSIFTSTNSGTNWTQATNAPPEGWIAVASSADGKIFAALAASGPVYISNDSGITWVPTNTPSVLLNCIALSADGKKLAAGEWNDYPPNPSLIFTTTNSGVTWASKNSPDEYWTSIASSADGTRLVAVGTNPSSTCPIFTSVDSGLVWRTTSAPQTNWYAVASSADGIKLRVCSKICG